MKSKRILSTIIGLIQALIGLFSGVYAILLGLDVINIQEVLIAPHEFLPIYLLTLSLFSFFSIMSALFLVREWRG